MILLAWTVLWLTREAIIWFAAYMFIAHLMVLTEEAHLRRVHGEAHADYCRRTPRYFGRPRRETH